MVLNAVDFVFKEQPLNELPMVVTNNGVANNLRSYKSVVVA